MSVLSGTNAENGSLLMRVERLSVDCEIEKRMKVVRCCRPRYHRIIA
jgi:hypothetical protein